VTAAFYIAGAVAVIATFMTITRPNAVHALLYLVVSLLAVALIFLLLGAPFAAALEVIIYAGAIMVLFVFVVMMLSMGPRGAAEERRHLHVADWLGPALLTVVLVVELIYATAGEGREAVPGVQVTPANVSAVLFGRYAFAVELVSLLLLVGLIGAYHLAYHLGARHAAERSGERQ
jgi:NADH-quinone oxidoreductase subunit J